MIAVIWFHWLLAMCYLPETVGRPSNGTRSHASVDRRVTVSEPHGCGLCFTATGSPFKRA